MNKLNKVVVYDIAFVIAMLVWFFLPLGPGPANAAGASDILFKAYNFPLTIMPYVGLTMRIAVFMIWLVPLFALLRITSLFIGSKLSFAGAADSVFTSGFRILVSSAMLFSTIIPLIQFAESNVWFKAIPPLAIASFILAFILSICSVVMLARVINYSNPVYREYRQFRTEHNKGQGTSVLDVIYRIRTKLFLAFLSIISVILLSLSILLLHNYQVTILEAVGDGAKSQVSQASTTYRVNLGDNIAMFEYLTRQIEQNKTAKFRYEYLSIYTNRKQELYLDALTGTAEEMKAEYSTIDPSAQYPDAPSLDGAKTIEWAKEYAASGNVIEFTDDVARTVSYASPIVKIDTIRNGDEKIRRERILGFSVMTFSIDTIMRPYFKTRSLVFVLTTFFLYVAIVLTYFIGNYIVNPLLFLRMNVRKISDILGTMISGQARISSTSLVYNDCVTSHDEIKSLSVEINDMVTVIRGIVPYISASTLKQAEKGIASTTRKELAFLFTDIRGFTTLCEGMQPEEVVGILNQYLDLETEIILNNSGDVDKFVGDEMMAVFEGPLKEENACRAAMQLRHAMMEEKERREKDGLPIVAIGIGVNSGPVVFGSVGARDRMDFTSIGDTVNLAARLEGANKAYGSKTIITDTVYEKVKESFLCRELDFIAVKGKNEPVRIFEILQQIPQIQPKLVEIKTLFEKGLVAYRAKKWKEANAAFKKNVELYNDAPSIVFLERIEHFMASPPPDDWDGVFRMTVK
jgi:class 3 adenylate cyclase